MILSLVVNLRKTIFVLIRMVFCLSLKKKRQVGFVCTEIRYYVSIMAILT